MKARGCSFFRAYCYGLLAVLALVCCGASAYLLFFKPQVPECRAVLWMSNQQGDKALRRALLISVLPDGARRAVVRINGSLFDNDVRYNIDRALELDYRRLGSNYTFNVVSNTRMPQDTLKSPELNLRLPLEGRQYHLRIEQVDKHHFLFVNNYGPMFVCATASGG
ncbi:hypothetical protein [Serratia ureilytica]|uniref:hypothetical protein n=1 Tax=Serratia ureilytica TaxID=300181 RepID=UPI0018D91BEC|nr:hypothetical protein [Serratia ureilytica]MBH2760521.1 hypothetical protein [Serratia ureilytica]